MACRKKPWVSNVVVGFRGLPQEEGLFPASQTHQVRRVVAWHGFKIQEVGSVDNLSKQAIRLDTAKQLSCCMQHAASTVLFSHHLGEAPMGFGHGR